MNCYACSEPLEKSNWVCSCVAVWLCSEECTAHSRAQLHLLSCEHEDPTFIQAGYGSTGSAASPDASTAGKVTALRRLMGAPLSKTTMASRVERVREAFEQVFPIEEYPFKVMGYNRGGGRVIPLNKERTVALATMFPHQQLVRDSRAPYVSDEGAIIIAPPGAGKTVMCHAVLANFSRQLVRIKTPFRYYLNADVSKKFTRAGSSSAMEHRILVYVTKTNLVGDVAKDLWAQNARSRDLFERMMEEARIADTGTKTTFNYSRTSNGEFSYAPFNKNVHVMSFKKFGNMLLGKNKVGRNFWAGKELDDEDKLVPIELPPGVKYPGMTPVPAAYWQDAEKNYIRGNRPHDFMQSLLEKDYNLAVRLQRRDELPRPKLLQLGAELKALVLAQAAQYRPFTQLSVAGVPPLDSLRVSVSQKQTGRPAGSRGRPQNAIELSAVSSELVWTANLLEKLSEKDWEGFVASLQLEVDTLFRRLLGPSSKPVLTAEFPVYPPAAPNQRGWRLAWTGKQKGKNYRWVPSEEGDYKDFNPVDRLVVVFDEGHLLFSPDNLLKAEEAFDSELIIQAFRESNGVAFFASATVDVITGVRMAQALTPLASYAGRRKVQTDQERREEDSIFPTYEGDSESFLDEVEARKTELGAAMAGRINFVDVTGMRDLFPDKIIGEELNVYYQINQVHAQRIKEKLGGSVAALMSTINVPFQLQEHHKLFTSLFDPDRLLLEFFGAASETGFPLGRALLQLLRKADFGKEIGELAGRGILSSALVEDTITAVAGLMQAMGYEWYYLIPRTLDDSMRQTRRRLVKNRQAIPEELRTVQFAGPLSSKHASPALVRQLGLEDMLAVPSLINGVETAPRFIVLSNDLLVSRDESAILNDTASFAAEALMSRDFSLPFRVRNVRSLKDVGASEALREQFKGTTKPVLHYYPATEAAQERARASLAESGGLSRIFEAGYTEPFFFIQGREDKRIEYTRVTFYGENPDAPLLVDPASFNRAQLQPIASEYLKMKDDFKSDARELIRTEFNRSIDSMRKNNLRYILLSRHYGQGIDAFRCPEVFPLEPSPDPATDEQRIGRFVRIGSFGDMPYDQWQVRYRTLVASYAEEVPVEAMISAREEPFSEILGPLAGSSDIRAVLDAVDANPLNALKAGSGQPLDLKRPLLPFQAVRVLTENPATTLRRARLLRDTLENWAIDRNYNRPERELASNPAQRFYSPTNYVLSSDAVVAYLRSQLDTLQLDALPDTDEELGFEFDRENIARSRADPVRYRQERAEWILSKRAPALERAGQRDLYTALLDKFNVPQVLQVLRRLAVLPEERSLLVSLGSSSRPLDLTAFQGPSDVHPLSQLGALVSKGLVRFDPGFSTTRIEPAEKPKNTKRSTGPASDSASKRPRPDEDVPPLDDVPEEDPMVFGSLPTSAYGLPSLIGAKDAFGRFLITAEEVHSSGTAVDRVAPLDQEQASIETATLDRLAQLASSLGLWADSLPLDSAEQIAAVYKHLRAGTKEGNPFRLQAGVLAVLQYGLLTLPRALEVFARGLLSYERSATAELVPSSRSKFMDAVAQDMGKLYQLSLAESSTADSLLRLKQRFEITADSKASQRSDLVNFLYTVCCSPQSSVGLQELDAFFVHCFGELQLLKRVSSGLILAQLTRSVSVKLETGSLTLIDVFELMGRLRTAKDSPMFRFVRPGADIQPRFDALVARMREAGSWNIASTLKFTEKQKAQMKRFADELSGGRTPEEWEARDREGMFNAIWTASGDKWPIRRWTRRLASKFGMSESEARDRLLQLYNDNHRFSVFKTAYNDLLATAPKPARAPRPFLYYRTSSDEEGLAVEASEDGYRWIDEDKDGKISRPAKLLMAGVHRRYPQLRAMPEFDAQQLLGDPQLAGLPRAAKKLFRRFSKVFRTEIVEPDSLIRLLGADQRRVKELRKLFAKTDVAVDTFLALAECRLQNLPQLVDYLKRLMAWPVAAELGRLVAYEQRIAESDAPVYESVEILLSLPGTSLYFFELGDRVSALTELFSVPAREVRRKVFEQWRDGVKGTLSQLVQRALPAIVTQLTGQLKSRLSVLDKADPETRQPRLTEEPIQEEPPKEDKMELESAVIPEPVIVDDGEVEPLVRPEPDDSPVEPFEPEPAESDGEQPGEEEESSGQDSSEDRPESSEEEDPEKTEAGDDSDEDDSSASGGEEEEQPPLPSPSPVAPPAVQPLRDSELDELLDLPAQRPARQPAQERRRPAQFDELIVIDRKLPKDF
jgi:hypothetical protein